MLWVGGGVFMGAQRAWVAVAGGHVVKGDVVGHPGGKAHSERSNLFMNVVHERIGGPPPMLPNGGAVNAIEFHSHGTTSP
jgi:hypothetical protein